MVIVWVNYWYGYTRGSGRVGTRARSLPVRLPLGLLSMGAAKKINKNSLQTVMSFK